MPNVNNPLGHTATARSTVVLIGMCVVLISVAVLRLLIGERFGWPDGSLTVATQRILVAAWQGDGAIDSLMDIRLNRLVLGIFTGSALAASGVALQALLRNPLAEPFILGLSSGAGVGVMTQMLASHYIGRQLGAPHMGALAGACGSMLIVYVAGRRRGVVDPLGLLLIGVVLSTINGAIIVLLNYVPGSVGLRDDLARWMMGYLNESVAGTPTLVLMGVTTVVGIAVLCWLGRSMDVASFSDVEAVSLGVNLQRLRLVLFVVASVLAAGAVVLAGPIAFVGLISPHLVRLLIGPSHRALVLGSVMVGALLILLADIAAVSLDFGQGRLPLGIFTAVLGGPIFVWMLRPHLGRGLD